VANHARKCRGSENRSLLATLGFDDSGRRDGALLEITRYRCDARLRSQLCGILLAAHSPDAIEFEEMHMYPM
jgi:hypothetical protein